MRKEMNKSPKLTLLSITWEETSWMKYISQDSNHRTKSGTLDELSTSPNIPRKNHISETMRKKTKPT
jgi:hypothetical protein